MADGKRPCRRGAQRQARHGALLRGRGRALGRQARPRHLRPRGQARPALDLQERHLPAGRNRAERRQVPCLGLVGVRLDAGVSGKLGAFGSLRLRPRDAAKLGRLLLTDGQWNGKQVIPAGWTAESIKPRINGEGLFFYGYQWWLGRSFRNGAELTWAAGVGLGGQRLYVVPALDLVVMINAGHYRDGLQGPIPFGIFNRVVLPAVKD